MESVNYEYFDSENDYSKNPNATKHRSFNVSRGDFSKYAILNGFYGKKLISRDARKFYSSKYAHDEYRSVLVDCRVGINQTPESIQAMNDLLVPLIKEKHQSIGHIYATHAEELGCSRRTLYSYISNCVFEVRNSDLSNAQS